MFSKTRSRQKGGFKNEHPERKLSPTFARRTGRTAASVVIAATASVGLISSAMAAPDDAADAQLVSATTTSGSAHGGNSGGHGDQESSGGHGGNASGHGDEESSGGHGGHGGEGGGDPCSIFLEHMWAI